MLSLGSIFFPLSPLAPILTNVHDATIHVATDICVCLLTVTSDLPQIHTILTNTFIYGTTMIPWLHFAGGDNLLFKSLRPSSTGAITAACIVLIALAVFERWVAGMRASLEARWRKRFASTAVIWTQAQHFVF